MAQTTVKDLDRLVAQIDVRSVAQIWWPLEGFRRVARSQNVQKMCFLYTLERNLMAIWQLWTFWTASGELPGTHTGYRKPFPIEFLKTKILAIWQHLAFWEPPGELPSKYIDVVYYFKEFSTGYC